MTIASIILTAALVLITTYYAWQTRRTVEEMRKARGAALRPRLTLSFEYPGAKIVFPVIANDGVGPAMQVEAEIRYEPDGPTIVWKAPVMAVGERHKMRFPDNDKSPSGDAPYEQVSFFTRCIDALGDPVIVEEVLRPQEYWEALVESRMIIDQDPIDEIRRELEKIRKSVEQMAHK